MVKMFINRPVLSIVISLIICLLGLLALIQLPVTQYPDIEPPSVTITTKYTGANAGTCAKAVVTPIERAINGVPGMTYMSSVSGNDGASVIKINFEVGTDPDLAAVNVQNRVATVLDELPEEVIKDIHDGLKLNGKLILAIPVGERGYQSDPDHKIYYNEDDLDNLLIRFGLRGIYLSFKGVMHNLSSLRATA